MLTLCAFLLATLTVALGMSLVINVNIYSMHRMYRDRLIRAYLGASRWMRAPDPFTGFDPQDNIGMWNLRPQCLWQTSFVNFEQFATELASKVWWTKPNLDPKRDAATLLDLESAREVVAEFNAASYKEKELENETVARVVHTLNDLMRCCDLENNVPAPRTVSLLETNRAYLELAFGKSLRKHSHKALRPDSNHAILGYPEEAMPKGKEIPTALQNERNDGMLEVAPLHIINTSLNIVGDNIAWRERKTASFTVTPLHSGSHALAYRDTAEYGGQITLGTAMAISGTPVSPSLDARTSPAFTFLMTLFSVRLGCWIGNPARKAHDEASPRINLVSLLLEAFGKTDASHDHVFLTDGGHFENLGLYEVVLRRCKYIVVCDASADGRLGFSDLTNAIRKIRIDLGVPIEPLVTRYVTPQIDQHNGYYCAFGKIRYDNVDGGDAIGYLVYIKPAISSDRPTDVCQDANEPSFPQEMTSETQFESYRSLGQHVIGMICRDKVGERASFAPNVATFFANAWSYVNGSEKPKGDLPISSVSDVVGWMRASLEEDRAKSPKSARPHVG